VPLRLQGWTQLSEIIYFPVEHNRDAAGFIEDRLMTGGEIDDAETAISQAHRPLLESPLIIWPTVAQAGAHALEEGQIHLLEGISMNDACDATHVHLYPAPGTAWRRDPPQPFRVVEGVS
jgi:hypothetical protein